MGKIYSKQMESINLQILESVIQSMLNSEISLPHNIIYTISFFFQQYLS